MSESGAPTGETEVTMPMPSLGKPGEPCEQCGTPLAADQRYCLNCGKRRGAPRVDYRALAPAAAPAAKPTPNGAEKPATETAEEKAEPPKTERDYAPLAAVGGIAILGLMLLVGVLIGRGDRDSSPAPAPVVLEGGSAQGGSETAGGSGSKSGDGLTGGGNSGGGAEQKAKSTPQEEAAKEGAVEASSEDLEALENETGEDAAKNALKLPDKIATPGAPPPIDKSVAPGAGEGGETIE